MKNNASLRIMDIFKLVTGDGGTLFDFEDIIYPTIEGNTSNFITDYAAISEEVDFFTARMYGSRHFRAKVSEAFAEDETPIDDSDIVSEWWFTTKSICQMHLDSWAHLYYALSIKYNPLWNVDGTTTFNNGEKVRTEDFAEREDTTFHDNTEDNSTEYATAYDSGNESETGKVQTTSEEYTDTFTAGSHLDTFTDETHEDTETRQGNIGVTSSQNLLNQEWEARKRDFFRTIVKTIVDEAGCMYKMM